ncbi:lactonase family protein [Gryllotalpicola ginsengisoli]|uniref:lactonase family protein n=1 Tax=Gryllotalpicola ginsengisoli TaxID=444608 RepID=UPI0003B51A2A|nr:beta-propeller fold lactonase family protein [Gryllotalpicola ginsengisoli]
MTRIWIGGYTSDMAGTARGIASVEVAPDGTLGTPKLAAPMRSPSFVAQHPSLPVLYAVGEKDGTFRAFRIADDGALAPLGRVFAAGAAACHVAVDDGGRFAVVACWGSGQVILYALDPETGEITGRSDAAAASDPYAGVPETELTAPRPDYAPRRSRAHFAQLLPNGQLLTTDLGFDLARVWTYDAGAGGLELDYEIVFPFGAGPRHVALAPNGRLYVDCEYAVSVFVLEPAIDGRYDIAGSSRLRRAPLQPGEAAAHVSVSPDGRLIYATIRKSDVIAVLAVGERGIPSPLAEVPSGAAWPRHHLLLGSRLYVANQHGDEITAFALDGDGMPGEIVQRVPTGAPTALVPALVPAR